MDDRLIGVSTPGPKPRGRVLAPFLVLLVLLTAGGAAAGWIYGEQVADRRATDSAGNGAAAAEESSAPATGDPCPQAAESAAEQAGSPGGLTEVLYIRTDDDKQVWICRDTACPLATRA